MPTVKFNKDKQSSFIKELEDNKVVVNSFKMIGDRIYVDTKNIGEITVMSGNLIVFSPVKDKEIENEEIHLRSKWLVIGDAPIAPVFIAYTADPENAEKTFDDFYDDIGVPFVERSDFATAALLNQVREIEYKETE